MSNGMGRLWLVKWHGASMSCQMAAAYNISNVEIEREPVGHVPPWASSVIFEDISRITRGEGKA